MPSIDPPWADVGDSGNHVDVCALVVVGERVVAGAGRSAQTLVRRNVAVPSCRLIIAERG